MINKRFAVREFGGAQAIKDGAKDCGKMLYAFGFSVRVPWDEHRKFYTVEDARAVCDWLNSRENGYPELNQYIYRRR